MSSAVLRPMKTLRRELVAQHLRTLYIRFRLQIYVDGVYRVFYYVYKEVRLKIIIRLYETYDENNDKWNKLGSINRDVRYYNTFSSLGSTFQRRCDRDVRSRTHLSYYLLFIKIFFNPSYLLPYGFSFVRFRSYPSKSYSVTRV